ncbi:unnamed protein product [Echinostoma caproni]|uniref:Ras-GEF domain-containing protein n=1 Tax=Echinostoma caproni TaxID=27848 RepID=A0A183AZR8_9TREM|nr:unnamed protein product [Echinostoma caproni]
MLPYVTGIYLTDLTYMDVAAATASLHENGGSWGNHSKQARVNNLLRIIANFQQSTYPFTRDEKVAAYLESQRYIEELQRFIEDNNYKLSLKLEPPTGDAFSATSSDSIYPFPVKTNWFTSTVLKPVPVSTTSQEPGIQERRGALAPNQSSASLLDGAGSRQTPEMHSCHSSPAHSISHRHRMPLDGFLASQLVNKSPSLSHSVSIRDRSSTRDRHSHDQSSSVLSTRPSFRHRRMGSWTGKCWLSSQMDGTNLNVGNSSCSISSGSTNRSQLITDHPVPVQQPLSQLLDQTDLATAAAIPNILSPVPPITGLHRDEAGSPSSEAKSGRSSGRSNRPKALTAILPTQPRVRLDCKTSGSFAGGDSLRSLTQIMTSADRPTRSPQLTRVQSSCVRSRTPRVDFSSNIANRAKSPTNRQTRLRHSASQPRKLREPISDRRIRNSPPKGDAKEGQLHSLQDQVLGHSGRSTPIRTSDSTSSSAKEHSQGLSSSVIPNVLIASTRSLGSSPVVPVSAMCYSCTDRSPSPRLPSSSDTVPPASQIHSTIGMKPSRSPSSVFSAVTGHSSPSHLAQAALAAVQGTFADQLARLSDTDSRHLSVPEVLPQHSSLISPTKAVCLDVQFSNGLSVLREAFTCIGAFEDINQPVLMKKSPLEGRNAPDIEVIESKVTRS